ncbi:MAG: hypothetical protein ACOCX5_01230 [Chloroflexota bacterium]
MTKQRYTQNSRQKQRLLLVMAVASVSLGLGALIALLFAQNSDDDMREQIWDQLEDILERGSQRTRQVADDIRDGAKKVRSEVQDRIEKMNS